MGLRRLPRSLKRILFSLSRDSTYFLNMYVLGLLVVIIVTALTENDYERESGTLLFQSSRFYFWKISTKKWSSSWRSKLAQSSERHISAILLNLHCSPPTCSKKDSDCPPWGSMHMHREVVPQALSPSCSKFSAVQKSTYFPTVAGSQQVPPRR